MCGDASPYLFPIVMVQQKDGTIHLCMDYRVFNSQTKKDAYPLPQTDKSLDVLQQSYFQHLASKYNQIPMMEKDIGLVLKAFER